MKCSPGDQSQSYDEHPEPELEHTQSLWVQGYFGLRLLQLEDQDAQAKARAQFSSRYHHRVYRNRATQDEGYGSDL
jgi:hypothetical protein